MIRWCSYCQQYMGESEPFDYFAMTHGICDRCRAKLAAGGKNMVDNAKVIMDYYSRLREACFAGNWGMAKQLIVEARNMNISPLDLCFGMIQPFLYEIGCLWQKAQVSVADEHKLTSICSSVIEMFFNMYPELHRLRQSSAPAVLLVNAENNYHVLGIRMLEFILMIHEVPTYTVFPGLPAAEVFRLIQELRPPKVGISVALGIQMKSVRELLELLQAMEPEKRPLVSVGGQAVHMGIAPEPGFDAEIVHHVPDFLKEMGIA